MTFSVPEQDDGIALHLVKGGIAISSDGAQGAFRQASRFFIRKSTGDSNSTWIDGRPVHQVNDEVLSLSADYEEMPASVSNSWTQGLPCGEEEEGPPTRCVRF